MLHCSSQSKLTDLLNGELLGKKVLIFTQTKRMADDLSYTLKRNGLRAFSIHGDKSQSARDDALYNFRKGKAAILVATDVAARGIDVKDVSAVVNYDFPPTIEDYIHRIGRTGRAGAKGEAYSFFTPDDARLAKELIRVLKEADQEVPAPPQHSIIGRSPAAAVADPAPAVDRMGAPSDACRTRPLLRVADPPPLGGVTAEPKGAHGTTGEAFLALTCACPL